MCSFKEIGNLTAEYNDIEVQWIIKNIFAYTVTHRNYKSPNFQLPDSEWCLHICPNGEIGIKDSVGYISLYLRMINASEAKYVTYSLGLKAADGTIHYRHDFVMEFHQNNPGFGCNKMVQISELRLRKSDMAPSGDLTVICILKRIQDPNCFPKLEELSDNFTHLFNNESGCDATLKVKEKEYAIHKSILSARSPVFAAMFDTDMRERNTEVVDINEFSPEAFQDFLAYVYSGKFENNCNQVKEIYMIANKYDVNGLKSACVLSMISSLTVENVCEFALLAATFEEEELQLVTQDFFNRNFEKIISTSSWLSFMKNHNLVANELLNKFASKMLYKDNVKS